LERPEVMLGALLPESQRGVDSRSLATHSWSSSPRMASAVYLGIQITGASSFRRAGCGEWLLSASPRAVHSIVKAAPLPWESQAPVPAIIWRPASTLSHRAPMGLLGRH